MDNYFRIIEKTMSLRGCAAPVAISRKFPCRERYFLVPPRKYPKRRLKGRLRQMRPLENPQLYLSLPSRNLKVSFSKNRNNLRSIESAQEGYIGEGRFASGSCGSAPPLCRILWVLSWRSKKVPIRIGAIAPGNRSIKNSLRSATPPAGTCTYGR